MCQLKHKAMNSNTHTLEYHYMQKRKRLDISIDPEIALQMRQGSVMRYGNNRSLSHLIEELFENFKKHADPKELTARRDRYDAWCKDNYGFWNKDNVENVVIIGISSFKCNTCYATFSTRPTDGKCCPACHSLDLELTHDEGEEPKQFEQWWDGANAL
jgi:Zn finger protein HypA/HybF involved in hydrogenase expression